MTKPKSTATRQPVSEGILCSTCRGDRNITDTDPACDRRGKIVCPTCHGNGWLDLDGKPKILGVRFVGYCPSTGKFSAALIDHAIARDSLQRVYSRVNPDARQQMLLAKRRGLWGVIASDIWADAQRGGAPK